MLSSFKGLNLRCQIILHCINLNLLSLTNVFRIVILTIRNAFIWSVNRLDSFRHMYMFMKNKNAISPLVNVM